jgi:hypothetical protein
MAGPTHDDDGDVADGFEDDGDVVARARAPRRDESDPIPSLDDADAVHSIPEGDDAIPSLDDASAVASLSDEAASSNDEGDVDVFAASASFAAASTRADNRALATEVVDERQVKTQLVQRLRAPGTSAEERAAPSSPSASSPPSSTPPWSTPPWSTPPSPSASSPPSSSPPSSSLRGRRPPVVAAVVAVAVVVVVVGAIAIVVARSPRGGGAPSSTTTRAGATATEGPERALSALRAALSANDIATARTLVDASVWPVGQPAPPVSLLRALASPTLARPSLPWTPLAGGAVRLQWDDEAAFAGLGRRNALTFSPVDGRLRVTAWASEGIDDGPAVGALLLLARSAIDERDGARLLSLVRPGKATCDKSACAQLKRAVVDQKPHPLLDAIRLTGLIEGSLRARPDVSDGGGGVDGDGGPVRLRYLRKTRAFGLPGVVDVVVAPRDGVWQFVAVDAAHATALEREAAVWQAEHAAIAWRSEVNTVVEVTALPITCERNILAWCANEIAPTRVKNIARTPIRRIQVTKVVAGKPTSSPWAIWTDISPGAASDKPVRSSPAAAGKGFSDLRTFDAYRIDWIELEGGRRLAPGTLPVPDDLAVVEAARRKAQADTATLAALRARVVSLGYPTDELDRLLPAPSPSR